LASRSPGWLGAAPMRCGNAAQTASAILHSSTPGNPAGTGCQPRKIPSKKNICLFLMNFTQLMGVNLGTSGQLDGFRRSARACPAWGMTAPLEEASLATLGHAVPSNRCPRADLDESDMERPSSSPKAWFKLGKPLSGTRTPAGNLAQATISPSPNSRPQLGTLIQSTCCSPLRGRASLAEPILSEGVFAYAAHL